MHGVYLLVGQNLSDLHGEPMKQAEYDPETIMTILVRPDHHTETGACVDNDRSRSVSLEIAKITRYGAVVSVAAGRYTTDTGCSTGTGTATPCTSSALSFLIVIFFVRVRPRSLIVQLSDGRDSRSIPKKNVQTTPPRTAPPRTAPHHPAPSRTSSTILIRACDQ